MRNAIATLLSLALLGLVAIALRGTDAEADPVDVSFYRLRVEYSTGADWSTLEVVDPSRVLTMRPIGTSGDLLWSQEDVDRLALNQTFDQAVSGQRVEMVVDYAVVPEARSTGLDIQVEMGSLNDSTVSASVLVEDGAGGFTSRHVDDAAVVPGTSASGDITLDLSSLTDAELTTASLEADATPKMLWALYYPWYELGTWDNGQFIDAPLTPYGSHDPAAVAGQVAQARGAGIDAFMSSWWGPGHQTDENFAVLLDAAAAGGMQAAIYLEPHSGGGILGGEELYQWLHHALTSHAGHPAYARLDGLPVVGIWGADDIAAETWEATFERLRSEGLDAAYMGGGPELASLELFDAGYSYLPRESDLEERSEALHSSAVRYYPLLSDSPRAKASVMTLSPGYDDRLVTGRVGTVIDREGGARYQRHADDALAGDPDWVLVTSWNEWYENTHIEPSQLYGDQYLGLTADFAAAWKGAEPAPVTPPPTLPPVTEPPVTEPPVTEPPVTEPPVTEPEPPTTSPPVTEPEPTVPPTTVAPPPAAAPPVAPPPAVAPPPTVPAPTTTAPPVAPSPTLPGPTVPLPTTTVPTPAPPTAVPTTTTTTTAVGRPQSPPSVTTTTPGRAPRTPALRHSRGPVLAPWASGWVLRLVRWFCAQGATTPGIDSDFACRLASLLGGR